MASPPFDINQSLPGDNDIVSQHPANARTFRDVVESWLKVNHNTNGRHDEVELDLHDDGDYAGTSSVSTVWASSTSNGGGILKYRLGTNPIEYVGVPPGGMMPYGHTSNIPGGWLLANGQAVSRSTFPRLFAAIG